MLVAALATSGASAHGDTAVLEYDYNRAVSAANDCLKAFGEDAWAAADCREDALRAGLVFKTHMTCHLAREKIEICRGHPRR